VRDPPPERGEGVAGPGGRGPMSVGFPELPSRAAFVSSVIRDEELAFNRTLGKGVPPPRATVPLPFPGIRENIEGMRVSPYEPMSLPQSWINGFFDYDYEPEIRSEHRFQRKSEPYDWE